MLGSDSDAGTTADPGAPIEVSNRRRAFVPASHAHPTSASVAARRATASPRRLESAGNQPQSMRQAANHKNCWTVTKRAPPPDGASLAQSVRGRIA